MAAPPRLSRRSFTLAVLGAAVVGFGLALPRWVNPTPPAGDADPAPAAPPFDLTTSFVKLGIGFVVVVGCCVLAGRATNRRTAPPPSRVLDVVGSLAVDARCRVYLVRAAGKRLLVGSDVNGVKAVLELTGPGPVEEPQLVGPVRATVPVPLPAR